MADFIELDDERLNYVFGGITITDPQVLRAMAKLPAYNDSSTTPDSGMDEFLPWKDLYSPVLLNG